MGTQLLLSKWGRSPQFSTHVYCGQTAGWMKMPLGTEVDLSPGHVVLDGDPALPRERGTSAPPPLFGPCLLWPNGWMNEDATWYRSRPRPRPHCVRWRPSSYPQKGHSSPRLFLAHVYCGHGHSSQLLLSSCLCVATACFVSIFVRFYYEFCIL